jgi:hypothetical protein
LAVQAVHHVDLSKIMITRLRQVSTRGSLEP